MQRLIPNNYHQAPAIEGHMVNQALPSTFPNALSKPFPQMVQISRNNQLVRDPQFDNISHQKSFRSHNEENGMLQMSQYGRYVPDGQHHVIARDTARPFRGFSTTEQQYDGASSMNMSTFYPQQMRFDANSSAGLSDANASHLRLLGAGGNVVTPRNQPMQERPSCVTSCCANPTLATTGRPTVAPSLAFPQAPGPNESSKLFATTDVCASGHEALNRNSASGVRFDTTTNDWSRNEYGQNASYAGPSNLHPCQPIIPNCYYNINNVSGSQKRRYAAVDAREDGDFMFAAMNIKGSKSTALLPEESQHKSVGYAPTNIRCAPSAAPTTGVDTRTDDCHVPTTEEEHAMDLYSPKYQISSPANNDNEGFAGDLPPLARNVTSTGTCLDCLRHYRRSIYPGRCTRCGEKHARKTSPHIHLNLDTSITRIEEAHALVYPRVDPALGASAQAAEIAHARATRTEHLQRFLDAINEEAGVDQSSDHWSARHQRTFDENAWMLRKSDYSSQMVTARLWLLFESIVDIYSGAPATRYATGGNNKGYGHQKMLLRDRLNTVREILRSNKRVAMDVIEGKGVMGFAGAPKRYEARKQSNNDCNERKSQTMAVGKRHQTEEQVEASPSDSRKRTRSRKRDWESIETGGAESAHTAPNAGEATPKRLKTNLPHRDDDNNNVDPFEQFTEAALYGPEKLEEGPELVDLMEIGQFFEGGLGDDLQLIPEI